MPVGVQVARTQREQHLPREGRSLHRREAAVALAAQDPEVRGTPQDHEVTGAILVEVGDGPQAVVGRRQVGRNGPEERAVGLCEPGLDRRRADRAHDVRAAVAVDVPDQGGLQVDDQGRAGTQAIDLAEQHLAVGQDVVAAVSVEVGDPRGEGHERTQRDAGIELAALLLEIEGRVAARGEQHVAAPVPVEVPELRAGSDGAPQRVHEAVARAESSLSVALGEGRPDRRRAGVTANLGDVVQAVAVHVGQGRQRAGRVDTQQSAVVLVGSVGQAAELREPRRLPRGERALQQIDDAVAVHVPRQEAPAAEAPGDLDAERRCERSRAVALGELHVRGEVHEPVAVQVLQQAPVHRGRNLGLGREGPVALTQAGPDRVGAEVLADRDQVVEAVGVQIDDLNFALGRGNRPRVGRGEPGRRREPQDLDVLAVELTGGLHRHDLERGSRVEPGGSSHAQVLGRRELVRRPEGAVAVSQQDRERLGQVGLPEHEHEIEHAVAVDVPDLEAALLADEGRDGLREAPGGQTREHADGALRILQSVQHDQVHAPVTGHVAHGERQRLGRHREHGPRGPAAGDRRIDVDLVALQQEPDEFLRAVPVEVDLDERLVPALQDVNPVRKLRRLHGASHEQRNRDERECECEHECS